MKTCGDIISLEAVLGVVGYDTEGGCAAVRVSNKTLGEKRPVQCGHGGMLELLGDLVDDVDGYVRTVISAGTLGDPVVTCDKPFSVEELLRMAIVWTDQDQQAVRVLYLPTFAVPSQEDWCASCGTRETSADAILRSLFFFDSNGDTVVLVNTSSLNEAAPTDCETKPPHTFLLGATAYDTLTGRWYIKVTEQ